MKVCPSATLQRTSGYWEFNDKEVAIKRGPPTFKDSQYLLRLHGLIMISGDASELYSRPLRKEPWLLGTEGRTEDIPC